MGRESAAAAEGSSCMRSTLHDERPPAAAPTAAAPQPEEIPWGECGADFVCESTGE